MGCILHADLYDDGTLLLAAQDAGTNPKNFYFDPITAEFFDSDSNSDENEGTFSLLQPAVYQCVSEGVYEAEDYFGDTHIIRIENSKQVTVKHIGTDIDGTYFEIFTILENKSLDYPEEQKSTKKWWQIWK